MRTLSPAKEAQVRGWLAGAERRSLTARGLARVDALVRVHDLKVLLGEAAAFEPEPRSVDPGLVGRVAKAARAVGVQGCADLLCEPPSDVPLEIAYAVLELAEPERAARFLDGIGPLGHDEACDWAARGYCAGVSLLDRPEGSASCAGEDPEELGAFLASVCDEVEWDCVPAEFVFSVAVLVDDREDELQMERAFQLVADGVALALCQAELASDG